MRERILALVDELKRRKADGESQIYVAPESMDALRASVLKTAGSQTSERASQGSYSRRESVPHSTTSSQSTRTTPPPQEAARAHGYSAPATNAGHSDQDTAQHEDSFEMKPYRKSAPEKPTGFTPPKLPPAPEFTLPEGDKQTRWEWLRERVLSCPVCQANLNPGKQIVFGKGNLNADIFFCGEAPGADEESQGIPFVGRAGQLLEKIITAMGITRDDVYIGNIMNWRPQTGSAVGNRPPSPEEMAFCLPYLRAQVEVIQPKVIVALGNTAVTGLLGADPKRTLGRIRGHWFDFKGTALMPTYHPSYVLRYGNNTVKRQIWEDMLTVMERVELPISDKQRAYFS